MREGNAGDGEGRELLEGGYGRAGGLGCGHVVIGEGEREKGVWNGGGHCDGRNGCGCGGWWGGRWAGKGVCNNILMAWKMDKVGGEFGKERKVSLLAGRKRGGGFGNGRNEGFVVSEKGERTTFEEKSKMFDGKESGQKFSVKSGIAGFCGRKFVGEKGQRLPGAMKTLLQDSTNVGV